MLIIEASEFAFKASPEIARARRVLIKPSANYLSPYPITTSPEMIAKIIEGIREVSDADILILEGTPGGGPIYPIYQALGYNFPRVLMLDVKDCIWVEVDNPLPKPFAIPTFWIPNVILSSDYLIGVSTLRIINDCPEFSIMNLLSTLPSTKYGNRSATGWDSLYGLGIDKILADLYFTLPFDVGIIEARQKFTGKSRHLDQGTVEEFNKVFIGEPFDIDNEACQMLGLKSEYLDLIKVARVGFEA
ncbi:MAG: DUF362 domain-containing protein [Dehalococcoidales bacterium]|nr:DUF362 domain-containing protein [Dehalococcoidales bacterium]